MSFRLRALKCLTNSIETYRLQNGQIEEKFNWTALHMQHTYYTIVLKAQRILYHFRSHHHRANNRTKRIKIIIWKCSKNLIIRRICSECSIFRSNSQFNIFHSLIENNLDSNNSTFSTSMNFHELLYLKYSNTFNKNQPDTEIPNQAVFFHLPTTANEMLCAIFASSLLI